MDIDGLGESQIQTFITDSPLPAGIASICHHRGIEVVVAIARNDFDRRASVGDGAHLLDGLAIGLNRDGMLVGQHWLPWPEVGAVVVRPGALGASTALVATGRDSADTRRSAYRARRWSPLLRARRARAVHRSRTGCISSARRSSATSSAASVADRCCTLRQDNTNSGGPRHSERHR